MERKDFLKRLGLAGLGFALPFNRLHAVPSDLNAAGSCVLIPSETAGPFPLDLSDNTFYFRKDVRESRAGVQLNLRLKILGLENCGPMPNVRVNIWHCDKDGKYSGYSVSGNPGQAGTTYLRGYQITDANGEVEFITILPGWYPGRVCHIHFRVYVNSNYAAISQLTFEPSQKNAAYAKNPSLYTKGEDPLTIDSDGVFSDGYAYQLASLTPNTTTGGLDSFLEVTVKGSGTVGTGHIERANAKQFALGQNYPNPFYEETTIPLTLRNDSHVKIELWDITGKKACNIEKGFMESGNHEIPLNLKNLGLANSNYVYQLQIENKDGVFKDYKLMTSGKQ